MTTVVKAAQYVRCYRELAGHRRPATPQDVIDYCVPPRPIIMAQVRAEILELASLIQKVEPKNSLEIGTNYGGTLFMLLAASPDNARVISVDLPGGRFGGGYPLRKVPLFRQMPAKEQRLHLIRANSHSPETKKRVLNILREQPLDYLFIDGDHSYEGVKLDFEMYAPLVRKGGMIAFHDIAVHPDSDCGVDRFWREVKAAYSHREIIDDPSQGWAGIGVLFAN